MWKAEKSRLKYVQQESANQKSGRADKMEEQIVILRILLTIILYGVTE